MLFVNSLNKLSKSEQHKFIFIFISVMLTLAIPFLFVEITYNEHLYIIFSSCSALLLSCKYTKLTDTLSEKKRKIISLITFILIPFLITFFIAPVFDKLFIFKNIFIIAIPYFLIFLIFRNSVVPVIVVSCFCFFIFTVNEIVFELRGTLLTLYDISALNTALTVASNYTFKINQDIYYSFLCLFTAITLTCIFPLKIKNITLQKEKISVIVTSITIFIISICITANELINYEVMYDFHNYSLLDERGICYNLTMNLADIFQKKPKGYSSEKAEQILNSYTSIQNENTPNIIVIMNESFSDVTQILDIQPSEEIMPFIHSLDTNVTKGKIVSPAYGGGTCNAEFEFLTGLTMTFLPYNSYPYLQYINDNITTINSKLDGNLYEKIYMHPYVSNNWRRSTIYPFLGFDKFYSGADFSTNSTKESQEDNRHGTINTINYEGIELICGYISDGATYDKAIELFENKPKDKKTLQFIVTMQNHSPYNYEGDDFKNIVSSGYNAPDLDQYLSRIKISDNEIKNLIEYFSKADEDTIIVFFGDHLPNYDEYTNIINSQTGFNYNIIDKYTTPFFIWTNFESETEYVDYVSLNYLSLLMKKKAGISLTQFDMFLEDMYKSYPVFSSNIIIDSNGTEYFDYSFINDPLINEYEILQYYYLFDN